MGTLKFAVSMLKKERKKSLVYTLTLCLTIAMTFLFFNIIDNPYLMETTDQTLWITQGVNIPFSSVLSFIVIIFCAFMIIFASNFYLSRKTKEIAIMTMSGSSYLNVTGYLFYQNMIMTLIAFFIGISIGCCLAMGINQVIYQYIQKSGPVFYVPLEAIGNTIVCIIAISIAQLIYASGFVYRKDIAYLLSQETRNISQDIRIIKIPPFLYVALYIFGLIFLLTNEYSSTSAIFPCCIGALGIGGMIKYYFPLWFKKIKQKKYLASKFRLISLSNLYYSLNRAIMLIGLYAIATTVLIAIMISQQESPREFITAIIGFIVIVLLLLVSIVYKYSMEASTRRMFYYNLYKLGYSYQQLTQIIKQEVFDFYMVLVGLPIVYIFISLTLPFIHQDIQIGFFIIVMISQLIPIVIAGITTYQSYKNAVLKVLEEGIRYE